MSTPPAEAEKRLELLLLQQAAADPRAWWGGQARQRLDWDTPFAEVLDDSNPPFYRWFADGTLNVSYNCLDRHVQARPPSPRSRTRCVSTSPSASASVLAELQQATVQDDQGFTGTPETGSTR